MQRGLLLLHHKRENLLNSPFKQQNNNIPRREAICSGACCSCITRENSLNSPFKQQDHNIHVAHAGGNMQRGLLLLHLS